MAQADLQRDGHRQHRGQRRLVSADEPLRLAHTADPGETGDQTTSEISYTGYARVAVARTSGGWTVTGNSVSPAANIDFAAMSGGTGGTATHFAVGTASSGTGKILYSGTISPNISVSTGVIPRLTTATAVTED